jgi:hypothetical protein
MTLSLAEAEQEKERQEYREYMAGQTQAKATLGDQFTELAALQAAMGEGPAEAPAEPAAPASSEEPPSATQEAAPDGDESQSTEPE